MKTTNNTSKNKFRYSGCFLICIVFLFNTCADALKEKPKNFYGNEGFFENTEKLKMAVNGIYEVFSLIDTYGQYWMVYDCDTDISFINGTGVGHVARDLGHYNIYVEHPWLRQTWKAYYRGIDRANTVLESKDEVKTTDEKDRQFFDQLIAETYCLRAMCYFDLVLLWGDVPMKTEASKAKHEFTIPRTDRKLVFDQIEKDFNEAIKGLQYASDQEGDLKGRLNKGAALGLLARMNLFKAGYFLGQDAKMQRYTNYKEYYQKVIDITKELINSNKHALLPNYETVFKNMCELKTNPTENIWEIPFFNQAGKRLHSSNMGTYNGPSVSKHSSFGRANSFIKTHHFFYDMYEENDARKDVAVGTFRINGSDKVVNIRRNRSTLWAPGKWRRNWQTGQVKDNNNTDVNCVLIRYADVLLMRAEAENEINGVTADAVEYLNQIRRRAHGMEYKTPNPEVDKKISDFASPDDFRNEIVDERARELCFEGLRRQDLIRWNLLNTKLQETKQKVEDAIDAGKLNKFTFVAADRFTPNKHELYPIPAYEVRETKGIIKQNPGYQQ